MENDDEEVNKLAPKETSPKDKPQAQHLESIPEEDNLESMEVDKGALNPKVLKKLLHISKV